MKNSVGYYFVAIIGIDGAGKSTAVQKIKHINPGFIVVDWEQVLQKSNFLTQIGLQLQKHPEQILPELKGLSRALALTTLLSFQSDYVIKPALLSGKIVIAESYVDVYHAKELLYQKAHPCLFELLNHLAQPDLTIFIDTPPHLAYKRKKERGTITKYECFTDKSYEDFVLFQSQLRQNLLGLIRHKNHIIIDGENSPEIIALQIQDCINQSTIHS